MATVESQGTLLRRGDAASPEVFTTIGEVTQVGGPTGSATVIDVSNLSSTRREKIMGLPDEGQINVTLNYDPTDAPQDGLRTDRAGRTLRNFQISVANSPSETISFSAYILEFSHDFSVDSVASLTVTLEITGALTYS